MKKLNIEYIKEYSKENDTICLSDIYIDAQHKLTFECNNGHVYLKSFGHFRKQKCPVCSGKRKKTIEEINEYCNKENFKCISKEYINKHKKLEFMCPKEHIFKMCWNDYRKGNRCTECNIEDVKLKFRYIIDLSLDNNMICLSKPEEYKNLNTKLKFKCFNNHIFYKSTLGLQQNKKCMKCHIDTNFGENTSNWNPNREEISLNKRIRNTFSKAWIIKNMKDDPNYNNYLLNSADYEVDHIIPVSAFCKYFFSRSDINEFDLKKLVNKRENLQLITIDENRNKKTKYIQEDFEKYITTSMD